MPSPRMGLHREAQISANRQRHPLTRRTVLAGAIAAGAALALPATSHSMARVDAFVTRHNNRYPLYPGQPAGSVLHGQCTALAEIYHREVCGGTTLIRGNGWEMYGNAPAALYHKLGAGSAARKGDMAVWNRSRNHVAIVLDDLGGTLRILSANNHHPYTGGNAEIITMSKTNLTGYLRPKTLDGATSPGAIRDGDFVAHGGHVYRVAGGAPIYVSTWAHFGGEKTVRVLSAAEFNGLRSHPADGTLVSGQAPGHAEHGTVYVIAGGAPLYVTSFDHVGANKPVINIDLAAVHNAGGSGPWARLRKYPANGTLISGQATGHAEHGTVYVIAGGAPVYVSSFNHVGRNQPVTNVSLAAVHNAGGAGMWSHLRRRPADGTLVSGQAPGRSGHGTVFVMAGGAPICVYSWANLGGSRPTTNIDLVATENAGKSGPWRYLLNHPADGTILRGHTSGRYFRVSGGRPTELASPTAAEKGRAVAVDQLAIDRAGQPLTHLLAPLPAGGGTLPSEGTTAPGGGSSFGS